MRNFTVAAFIFAPLAFVASPLAAPVAAQAADPATASAARQPTLTGFPFTDEDLNYSVNWPTGMSLGEAHLHAKHSGTNWNLGLTIDAGIPGYAVKDSYHSDIVPDYCSISFDRSTAHGARTVQEKETINRDRSTAALVNGGKQSGFAVPPCVKDALAYLYYTRREMGQGRVPAAQQILLGGLYEIRVDYVGAPIISVDQKEVQSDKVTCTFKGSASEYSFDIYFARDPARTPLLITAPLAMGRFSMELIR